MVSSYTSAEADNGGHCARPLLQPRIFAPLCRVFKYSKDELLHYASLAIHKSSYGRLIYSEEKGRKKERRGMQNDGLESCERTGAREREGGR